MTTTTKSYKKTMISDEKKIYLHIGPSGDSWIGDAIFAAKHNQSGYVKSITLTNNDEIRLFDVNIFSNEEKGKFLVDVLEEHPEWAQEVYDTECFPKPLLDHLASLEEDIKS